MMKHSTSIIAVSCHTEPVEVFEKDREYFL